jgi:hypothetical protein
MYHVCFSNPNAWAISYQNGVYGNVQTGNENFKVFWGKIIDLVALKPGDKVFFYVKDKMCLHGLFEVSSEPYFCEDDLFENENEKYPFRFNFNQIKSFYNPIPVSELAKLIENGHLYSITTFERDQNSTFRGIRQLTNDEGKIIEETFLKYNPKANLADVPEYNHPEIDEGLEAEQIITAVNQGEIYLGPTIILFNTIPVARVRRNFYVARYENSLQGYIYYSLRRRLNNVIEDLEVSNFSECLMEVPMLKAQQFRSDILCLYREGINKPHFYSIIETKKDRTISIQDLSQLIGYMKTFSSSKGIPFNCIEGVYISTAFEEEAVIYLRNRKYVEKENPVRLIQYSVNEIGEVSFNPIEI